MRIRISITNLRKPDPDPYRSKKLDPDLNNFRSFRGSKWSHGGPWTLKMLAWRIKMEPWRLYISVFTDSHHFDEEQDPDPHLREKKDPDPHFSESSIKWCVSANMHLPQHLFSFGINIYLKLTARLVVTLPKLVRKDFAESNFENWFGLPDSNL